MLDLYIPKRINKIGLRLSGGADSAIVGFALAHYAKTQRPDIEIVPITIIHQDKPYQKQFAENIIKFLKEQFGDFGYSHHCAFSGSDDYIMQQNILTKSLYAQNIIQAHFIGITKNPAKQTSRIWENKFNITGPVDDRDKDQATMIITPENQIIYRPLKDKNKRQVAQLYKDYDVLDTLFPLTRSCEQYTKSFEHHCGECWFCQERLWGFGKL